MVRVLDRPLAVGVPWPKTIEDVPFAHEAQLATTHFFVLLGLQTKPSKAQAPVKEHVVQGVEVAPRPTGKRQARILAQIDEALQCDGLSPDAASRLDMGNVAPWHRRGDATLQSTRPACRSQSPCMMNLGLGGAALSGVLGHLWDRLLGAAGAAFPVTLPLRPLGCVAAAASSGRSGLPRRRRHSGCSQ